MAEARNLRQMTAVQTPLLGQENTPMHREEEGGTGYEGATPRHGIAATPNPLATPARGVLATPRTVGGASATPMRTPRDNLMINDNATPYAGTALDEKRRAAAARRALKAGFASLPKPENNFELAEDEDEEAEEEEVILSEEDAAERDAKMRAAREEEERLELERRSSVVKRSLPRPANVDIMDVFRQLQLASDDDDQSEALKLINYEMAELMKHDSLMHPLPGSSSSGNILSEYDMPEDSFVSLAKSAIHDELAGALGLPGATEDQLRVVINSSATEDDLAFSTTWATERAKYVFSAESQSWVDPESLSPDALQASYTAMVRLSRERMVAEAQKAAKLEKKVVKQLGGYQAINAKAKQGIIDTINEIHQTKRELETFLMLKAMEEAAAPGRLEQKREEVERLERRERDLQARYAELNDERRERVAAIEQVSNLRLVPRHAV
jgi:pre-mRNA-splicing factor CDC5/CEF1